MKIKYDIYDKDNKYYQTYDSESVLTYLIDENYIYEVKEMIEQEKDRIKLICDCRPTFSSRLV